MSQQHNAVEKDSNTNPIGIAISVLIGAAALIVGIIMLAYFAIGTHTVGAADAKALSPDAINQRLAPVAYLATENNPGQAAAPAPKTPEPVVVAAATPSAANTGEAVYKGGCVACHSTGVAGSPKTGDKTSWAPRIAKGKTVLYEHALKGFNAMPAKGGNASLADSDVKAAVDYLVAQAK